MQIRFADDTTFTEYKIVFLEVDIAQQDVVHAQSCAESRSLTLATAKRPYRFRWQRLADFSAVADLFACVAHRSTDTRLLAIDAATSVGQAIVAVEVADLLRAKLAGRSLTVATPATLSRPMPVISDRAVDGSRGRSLMLPFKNDKMQESSINEENPKFRKPIPFSIQKNESHHPEQLKTLYPSDQKSSLKTSGARSLSRKLTILCGTYNKMV